METCHEINVNSLDFQHRRALEDVIGVQLQRNQRIRINVTEVERPTEDVAPRSTQSVGDWTQVYEGLTDEEVEAIDREVNTRANLTRNLT